MTRISMAAVGVLVVVALLFTTWQLVARDREIDRLEQRVEQLSRQQAAADDCQGGPGSEQVQGRL